MNAGAKAMTVFHLVRHGHHDLLGRELVGRRAGVHLSGRGQAQAEALGAALKRTRFAAVLSSPRERALETALPIARGQGGDVEIETALDEIDFGAWTGRSFADLAHDPEWRHFNAARARAAIPGGERMLEAQTRVLALLERIAGRSPEASFALVTHGDVIRCALLHYLGMPLDFVHRLEISPASDSVLSLAGESCRVLGVNLDLAERQALPAGRS